MSEFTNPLVVFLVSAFMLPVALKVSGFLKYHKDPEIVKFELWQEEGKA